MVLLDLYIHIFLGYANYIFSSLTGMFDRCVQFRPWLLHTQTNVFLDTQDCEEKKPHSNLLLQVINGAERAVLYDLAQHYISSLRETFLMPSFLTINPSWLVWLLN
jgi:hypothetical protein